MENKLRKLIREKIELDIEIGDEILAGRFKNKKVVVKDIGKDDKNQPTINGKTILKFRIKKLIKEEIKKLFETLDFQTSAAEQIARNSAMFQLPRKGIADDINDFNLVQTRLDKENSKEDELEKNFDVPSEPNNKIAVVSTNIFEDVTNSMAAQKNLDGQLQRSSELATFGKDAQDDFDDYNDNINKELTQIPPGNSREKGVSNNKSKNF